MSNKRRGFGQLSSFVFMVIIEDTVATLIVTVVGAIQDNSTFPQLDLALHPFLRSAHIFFKEALRS